MSADKPIAVGDLVQVIKPGRCGCTKALGEIFVVAEVNRWAGWADCIVCGKTVIPPNILRARDAADGTATELERLKRLPPLSELEGERTEEQLREPA